MTFPWILFAIALSGMASVATALWLGRAERKTRPPLALDELVHLVGALRLGSDAVCLLDIEGRIAWTNPAYLAMTGYESHELVQLSLCDLLRERVNDPAPVQAINDALRERRELRVDLLFQPRTRDAHWTVVELHPILDPHSLNLVGYGVVHIDIDDQRRERDRTQQALRDRQAVLDILDKHALVTETDLTSRITRVNQRFMDVSGYTKAELLGQRHSIVSSGRHGPEFWTTVWRTISQGRIWQGEICNRAKDGSLYWVDSVIAPMLGTDGRPVSYVSIRTDITALKRSRDMLSRTGRVAGIGGWYCNLQTDMLYFTDAACRILCLGTKRIPAQDILLQLLPSKLAQGLLEAVREVPASGEPFSKEVEVHLIDGSHRWIYISCEKEEEGDHGSRLVGAVQDITDQVQARMRAETSARLLRSAIDALGEAFALYDEHERLVFCNDKYRDLFDPRHQQKAVIGLSTEQVLRLAIKNGTYTASRKDPEAWLRTQLRLWRQPRYQQRAQLSDGRWVKSIGLITPDGMLAMFRVDITDLQLALEAADAASTSKGQFLANMSHEIRTPINAIMGMLQLLKQTRLTPEQQDLLLRTKGAARSLLGILNDVLDFSKIEAGKMSLDPEPFVLDDLLTDLATILHGALENPSLELIYDIDPRVPPVLVGDAQRLKQILINLGGNAIKFTEQGQVQVLLRVLRQDAQAVRLRFSVLDSGIGIKREALKDLFSAFSQAEGSTSRRYGGAGLGLAISRRLVALMDGRLQVASEPGTGSCFYFDIILPIAATAPPRAGPPHGLQGAAALLLEPHPVSRQVIGNMLRHGLGSAVCARPDVAACVTALADTSLAPALAILNTDVTDFAQLIDILRDRARLSGAPEPRILLIASQQLSTHPSLPVLRKPLTLSMISEALRRGTRAHAEQEQASTARQRLRGLRLLLVEDNEINQMVAVRLLENEGAAVTSAADGQQGLDALRAAPERYDLVLMDVQMPVIDGLQATRAIRRDPRHAKLPIVAMTANAGPADRRDSLAAGMDDHVGKPFELEHLIEVILDLTGRRAPDSAPRLAVPQAPAESQPDAVAPAVLDTQAALARLDNDKTFYSRLLRDFAPAARKLARQIIAASRHGDAAQARAAAHQLKSSAASTGAQALSMLCARLEQADQGQTATRHADLLSLESTLEQALSAQDAWLRRLRPAADEDTAPQPGEFAQALAALRDALLDDDMESLELFDELIAAHGDARADALLPLRAAMDDLDTDAAVRAIEALLAGDDAWPRNGDAAERSHTG